MTQPPLAAAATIRAIYAESELRLIETIQRRLARGLDDPGWAGAKLADVLRVRADLERQIVEATVEAARVARAGIEQGYELSTARAVAEIEALGRPVSGVLGLGGNPEAVRALAEEAAGMLGSAQGRILRVTLDAYREAVIGPAGSVLTGAATRRQAAQAVLDRLATRGIVGFVDAAGRSWEMSAYAEAVTRTAVGRASVEGHTRTLLDGGYDLARVSTSPRSCPLCDPWEGRIVSLSGRDDRYPSLDAARASGLHHPNCTHTEGVYIPGVSRAAPPRPAKRDRRAAYEAQEAQRYNERQIRAWKRREAAALDDSAARAARGKVREYQARQRELLASDVAKESGLYRLPSRESISRAH